MTPDNKTLIGCEEWCSLPELNIPALKARVDSGARTSALHAFSIAPFTKNNAQWVRFSVHPLQNNRQLVVQCEAPVVDRRLVKSSSGTTEKRFVIHTLTQLNGEKFTIELTLSNRDTMGYRMLLGREAMEGRIVVDPAEHFCLGQPTALQLNQHYGELNSRRDGLKIALLATNPTLYTNQMLLKLGRARGHEMVFLDIHECYVKLTTDSGELHYVSNDGLGDYNLGDFDAVIPRLPSTSTDFASAILRHFERLGVFPLNSAESIARSLDPLLALQIFQTNELPIPVTAFANGVTHRAALLNLVGDLPVIIKQLRGNSRSVRLAKTREEANKLFADVGATTNLLVQKYIADTTPSNLRVWIAEGKVLGAVVGKGEFIRGRYIKDKSTRRAFRAHKASKATRQLALRAIKALHLRTGAVDMLVSDSEGPILLGVVPAPGLKQLGEAKALQAADKMLQVIERHLGWKG